MAGIAPGNRESAGKRGSGKTSKGHRFLRTTLVQAARAAARTKGTYLNAQYRRLATRRGKKRAILAVVHSILVMACYMLARSPTVKLRPTFGQLQPEDTARRLVKGLESLGYHVTLQSSSTDVVPESRGLFQVSIRPHITRSIRKGCLFFPRNIIAEY